MYLVYILYSDNHDSFYIGYTNDIERRLKEHNTGLTRSIKSKIPWRAVYSEQHITKSSALKRERFLKKQKNKSFYKKLVGIQ